MKLKFLPVATLIAGMASLSSCEKDYEYVAPPPNPNVVVSFASDIQPIFTTNCANSSSGGSCHYQNANPPDLTSASISYAQMWTNDNGTILVDTTVHVAGSTDVDATASKLYKRVYGVAPYNTPTKIMPPTSSGSLTSTQKGLISNWITQGAKNN
jgi:hypothetical protein